MTFSFGSIDRDSILSNFRVLVGVVLNNIMLEFFIRLRAMAGLTPVANAASRQVAKERLSIILQHQRGHEAIVGVDMNALKADVIACIKVRFGICHHVARMPWAALRDALQSRLS